ncbi:glycosyltransferase [bacterium]|nr:glycosyltransferase [bacterium]
MDRNAKLTQSCQRVSVAESIGSDNDEYTYIEVKNILQTGYNSAFITYASELYVGWYKNIPYILLIKNVNKGKNSFLEVQKTLHYCEENNSNFGTIYHLYNTHIMNNNINIVDVDYVLMLDTDTLIKKDGIQLLVDYLNTNPLVSGVCGETCISNINENIVTMSQYYEYWITHYTLKSLENVYGNVLVLSGCFTLYRKSVLTNTKLMELYSEESNNTLYDANVTKLGEDRLFTNLLLQLYPELQTKYIKQAKCYTNAPSKLSTLLCQRRRWSNSLIFCNVMLLLNLPRFSLIKKILFGFILLVELWICLIMPLLMTISYYFVIEQITTFASQHKFDVISFIETCIFMTCPMLMCVILFRFNIVLYSLSFILLLPVYGIIIPLYSIYYSDYVAWGKTRKITVQEEV